MRTGFGEVLGFWYGEYCSLENEWEVIDVSFFDSSLVWRLLRFQGSAIQNSSRETSTRE